MDGGLWGKSYKAGFLTYANNLKSGSGKRH